MTCPFGYHDVTEEDVDAGTFQPSVTWGMYSQTGYSGDVVTFAPTLGPVLPIASRLATITDFEVTAASVKDNYVVGDELLFSATVVNGADENVGFTLSEESAVQGTCSAESVAPGDSLSCENLSYMLTQEDIERGQVEVGVLFDVLIAGESAQRVGETTTVPVPSDWPAAVPFTMRDADPTLEADLSDLLTIDVPTNDYNIRIPAIAVASNGDVLASYDLRPIAGGADGGDSPNANWIVQKRSTDNGKTWGPRTVIAQGNNGDASGNGRIGYSDPSYVVDSETGTIFNFHVYSQLSSVFANSPAYTYRDGVLDETDPHTMNFGMAVSKDDGHTWENKVITAEALGDKGQQLQACFATSGAGTQKMQEPHKGRLLQQYACVLKHSSDVAALTVYSDDHGETWQSGELASVNEGGGDWHFDENKVVELSDGRLLLNSRTPSGTARGYRLVAISEDGGETWSGNRVQTDLPDVVNNAQVIRAFPNADPGTLRSQVLLFSNSQGGNRAQGTISLSYDDGNTWPIKREFRSGGTGYTTMAVQEDGSIGLLLEPAVFNEVGYVNFTLPWISEDLPFELKIQQIGQQLRADRSEVSIPVALSGDDPTLENTVTVTGLPEGLEYDSASGAITGTTNVGNEAAETYEVTVTVAEEDDGTGVPRTATESFALVLMPEGSGTDFRTRDMAQWTEANLALPDYAKLEEKLASADPLTWLFTGDSITQGVVHSNGLKRFSEYFEDYLRTDPLLGKNRSGDVVINTGVSSADTNWLRDNIDAWMNDRNPDVVFMTFGMNDGRSNTMPLATYRQNLETTIAEVRAAGAVPILMTQNYTTNPGNNANLVEYFMAEREIAATQGVLMVDMATWWTENNNGSQINSDLMNDSLHPNQQGHLAWGQTILRALDLLGDSRLSEAQEASVPPYGGTVEDIAVPEGWTGGTGVEVPGSFAAVPQRYFEQSDVELLTGANIDAFAATDAGNITVRFKMDPSVPTGSENVIASFVDSRTGKMLTVSVVNNEIRLGRNWGASYGYFSIGAASGVKDGQFHVVSLNMTDTELQIHLDGTHRETKTGDIVGMRPSRYDIDTVTLGGAHPDYLAGMTGGPVNAAVTIDYVEAFDRYLTGEEIAGIPSGPEAGFETEITDDLASVLNRQAGQMWSFLGGATTQGTMAELSAKNYVQVFEEVIRWENGNQPLWMRMRFVGNTGLNGLNSQDLLDRYNSVVAPQSSDVVVVAPDIMFKGEVVETSVEQFSTNIGALIDQIAADGAVPLLITPMQLGAAPAEYAAALRTLGDDKGVTVVDLNTWLNAVDDSNQTGVLEAEWFDVNGFARAKGQLAFGKQLLTELNLLPQNLGGSKIWALNYDGDGTPTDTVAPEWDGGPVVPGVPEFDDENWKYTIPETEGVTYLVDGTVTAAGTYGAGFEATVVVTAEAEDGYVLDEDATDSWSHTFPAEPAEPTEAFRVVFNLSEGEGDFEVLTVGEDGKVTIPLTVPARDGYKFLGWLPVYQATMRALPAPLAEPALLQPGETFEPLGDVTLVAQWQKLPVGPTDPIDPTDPAQSGATDGQQSGVAADADPSGKLPTTGNALSPLALGGIALLLGGAVTTLLAARSRRT